VTPKDMFAGHQQEIQAERDRKLDAAKEQRKTPRSPEESLYLGTRAAVEGSPSVRQSAAH